MRVPPCSLGSYGSVRYNGLVGWGIGAGARIFASAGWKCCYAMNPMSTLHRWFIRSHQNECFIPGKETKSMELFEKEFWWNVGKSRWLWNSWKNSGQRGKWLWERPLMTSEVFWGAISWTPHPQPHLSYIGRKDQEGNRTSLMDIPFACSMPDLKLVRTSFYWLY